MTDVAAPRIIPVFVVLPPKTMLLDVAGPIEVLRRANREQKAVRFDVRYIGSSSSVVCSIGLTIAGIEPFPETLPDGAMVVISGDVDEVMTRPSQSAAVEDCSAQTLIADWLRAAIRPGHKLVCICSCALPAARAGLLDGYACTTHYLCCAELTRLAPKARVIENRLFVEDGERYSSAGITAGIDLMLHLLCQLTDHRCALAVARYLVVYLRRAGADPQLSPWLEGRSHIHPAVHRVQDAIAADPARAWTLEEFAALANVSPRHLSRLFNEHSGMGIADYCNRLRAALARQLLTQTRLDMEDVAERAGFASTRQLRRVWRQFHGTAPSEARQQATA